MRLGEPASGPGTHSPGSDRSRNAGRQWGSGPDCGFAPLSFLKTTPGLPGGPRPRCSGRRSGAPRKVGHLVTGPEQCPVLKGVPSTQEGREPGGHGRSPGRQEVQEAPASLQVESQALSSATGEANRTASPQMPGAGAGHKNVRLSFKIRKNKKKL